MLRYLKPRSRAKKASDSPAHVFRYSHASCQARARVNSHTSTAAASRFIYLPCLTRADSLHSFARLGTSFFGFPPTITWDTFASQRSGYRMPPLHFRFLSFPRLSAMFLSQADALPASACVLLRKLPVRFINRPRWSRGTTFNRQVMKITPDLSDWRSNHCVLREDGPWI